MKRFLYSLFVLALCCNAIFAQVSSTCTPSALFTNAYKNDATDLALKRMYELLLPDTALINVPTVYVNPILNSMAAIDNVDSLVHADSIFRKYCIHSFPYGFINTSLSVKVDTAYAWAREWSLMHNTTGNTPLDNFMSRYGFTLRSYFCSASSSELFNNVATIATTSAINTRAFADSLAHFGGVLYTYPDNSAGEHNSITLETDSVMNFSFIMGWGDCIAGCTSSETWNYSVNNSCVVTLTSVVRNGMDPYPSPTNCNMLPYGVPVLTDLTGISAYPNPANDLLHISKTSKTGLVFFSLSDICGRVIIQGSLENNLTLNISGYPQGMYILHARNELGAQYFQKIIKE